MLGTLKNWNIIKSTNKITFNEDFYQINEIVIDGISENIYSLLQTGKHGAISTTDKMDITLLDTCQTHLQ